MIGLKFATESGLLLKLGQYLEKYEVAKFECAPFSCFPEEQETLFFGGETVLKIKGALQWVGDALMKYDRFMEPINAFSRMMNGLSVKDQEIMNNARSQRAMKVLLKDILRSLVLRLDTAEAPKYIQDLVLFHHDSTPRVRLAYDELKTEYKWLDSILKSDTGDTLNITNVAVLFCHSDDIVFMMPDEYVLSEAECVAMVQDLAVISEMALAVKISLIWKTGMPQDARTNLRNALPGLYGKDCVHHFDSNSASFTFEDAAIDVEAQEAIQALIESMIQKLAPKPKKKKVEEPVSIKSVSESLKLQKSGGKLPANGRLREVYDAICGSELGSLLPPPICQEIAEYGRISLDSNILTDEEQTYLVELVECQGQTQHFKYAEWDLMCSYSKHGDQYANSWDLFHKTCDGQKHTVCLMEIEGTGYICGGYASTEWKSTRGNTRAKDDHTYLFVIRPVEKRNVFHRKRDEEGNLVEPEGGILWNGTDGFNFGYNHLFFGNGERRNDRIVYAKRGGNYYTNESRADTVGRDEWTSYLTDYEVFQLNNKM